MKSDASTDPNLVSSLNVLSDPGLSEFSWWLGLITTGIGASAWLIFTLIIFWDFFAQRRNKRK